jgi:hypothetical protein
MSPIETEGGTHGGVAVPTFKAAFECFDAIASDAG